MNSRRSIRSEEAVTRSIVGFGIVLFLAVPAQWIVFEESHPIVGMRSLVSLLTTGVPALGVAYGGYRIERGDLPPDRYPRIAGWCFGGAALFLAVNLVIIAAFPADTLAMNVGWAIGTVIYGAVGGVTIGAVEARAIERARAAERAAVEAERAEVEREWLDYLNTVLRHEVLNTANVIEGQTVLLAEELDREGCDRLETIRHQSRDMTRVIDDVRVLIRATKDAGDFEPVQLLDLLTAEVRALEDAYDEIEVDLAVSDDPVVLADGLLPRVFSNLLRNAIEHNDAPVPRVQVSAEAIGGTAVVEVSDNGPGIPPERRSNLFDRNRESGREHGLGLYLVRTLVERYGGSVELAETGPQGSTFRVELPLASEAEPSAETDTTDPIAADGR